MLAEEVIMVRGIGVEISPSALHRDLAQEASFRKLMKRVVHRGERHRHFTGQSLLVQRFRRNVTVAFGKEEMGQRHALPRGPETGAAQEFGDVSFCGPVWRFERARRWPTHLQ